MNRMHIANVDLNVLKVFEALFEEGSATRAAARLEVTQSAISAALRRLRTLYGDPLFQRGGHGLVPTLRANELKPFIGEALDKFRQSLAMATPATAGWRGRTVSIGLSDDFEIAIARALITALEQHAPGLRLIFRQTHSQIVSDNLMERQMDLAISAGGLLSRALGRQVLGEGDYACLVDPAFHRGDAAFTLDAYLAQGHVLISSGGFSGIVDEGLAPLARERRVVASTTHFSALPYLLKGTPLIATVPGHAARAIAAMTGLQLLPCPLALPHYAIELGWRADALRDPAVAVVKAQVMALFAQWPKPLTGAQPPRPDTGRSAQP